MATVDKIYGTKHQYDHFIDWCRENNPGTVKYFYEDNKSKDFNDQRPICNFPIDIDHWMLNYCPIDFVINQIKEQYGIKN